MDKGIEKVPLNASVTAYGLLIPHLSKNLQLYYIDYVKTINTEYVVIDERVNKQYPLKDYKLIYEDKGVIAIYKKYIIVYFRYGMMWRTEFLTYFDI